MNKSEFLGELRHKLKRLPAAETEEALLYYEEYFHDAGPENEKNVLKELNSPSAVAAKIIGEYAVHASESPKGKAHSIWVLILTVCAVPIALPLAISALVLFISLWIVFASFGIAGVAFMLSGAVSLVSGLITIFHGFSTSMFYFGYAMLTVAIGIPILRGTLSLSQRTWRYMQNALGKALVKRGAK